MKILLAPDSYKGSLSAKEACDAMERGVLKAIQDVEIIKAPMADGGEGTMQSLIDSLGGTIVKCKVKNPLGDIIVANYAILYNGIAVIEMAEASGLTLIGKEQRNPLITSTFGTGELIKDALDHGCRNFIIGLGGSATNDCGAGMAQALGFRILNKENQQIEYGGVGLSDTDRIDISRADSRIFESQFTIACDVDNILCGENGASYVFGPQKGATPEICAILDRNINNFATVIERDMNIQVKFIAGAGAAGGLGAGMIAFLNANLKAGADIVIEATQFKQKLRGADLVITGEGSCDSQTIKGKTPYGVAKTAKTMGIPTVIITGNIGKGTEILYQHGVVGIFTLVNGVITLNDAMKNASILLEDATERTVRCLAFFMK
ncbi:MAG TPA: glycerate kinase [Clostridia bacterium]|nr:glycerate kinase [Clostridia bacterium]